MRFVIFALLAFVLAPAAPALAQDFGALRGSEPVGPALYTNWTGFYIGGHWGDSDVNADFSNSTQAPIAYVLRNSLLEKTSSPSSLPTLGTADHSGASYGGFVGYNTQWTDLILGLEANYVHTTVSLNAPSSPIVRTGLSDGAGNSYTVGISASGTLTNLDYVSLRGRAGVILGNALPYGFIGGVVGLADLNIAADVVGTCDAGSTATCSDFAFSATGGRNSALLYGGTIGAGLDYALTQNIFVRGEYEYVRFVPFANVPIAISSFRVGAGLKFW